MPIHSSLFYIYSLLFVALFLEVEDKSEAGLHISTFEPLSKEVKILKESLLVSCSRTLLKQSTFGCFLASL